MTTAPGAAMQDEKVFIVRNDPPYNNLYERWWDGDEWSWVSHGRPANTNLVSAPAAAMLDKKLFVTGSDGKLWERHWREDLGRWVWYDHGRPANQVIATGPGAVMFNEKLFVATQDGDVWERHWRADLGQWAWQNHGRPDGQRVVHTPGAAMAGEKFFVVTITGQLWERHWRADLNAWVWEDHGRPGNESIVHAPGAAMADEKLFVVTNTGNLWERHWRSDLSNWAWENHGRPVGEQIDSAPGATMEAEGRLFVRSLSSQLFERCWNGSAWVWRNHGRPPGTLVFTAPGGAMLGQKLFVGASNGHMFERADLNDSDQWMWIDHGKPIHDQSAHVIDNRGRGEKKTIAILSEGFTEVELPEYRQYVQDELVNGVFQQDLFAEIRSAFNVVRIDMVSIDSGVSQRRYNEVGMPNDGSDDTVRSETWRNTRLAFWYTGQWSHCWMEDSNDTNDRIARVIARHVPDADYFMVVLNETGSGGCRNGTRIAVTLSSEWTTIAHELGHVLGNLADEYTKSGLDFTGTTFTQVNCSASADRADLKWATHVSPDTDLPTDEDSLHRSWDSNQDVGAFDGCGTYETGLYRPVLECRMRQNASPFCPVCAEEMRRLFYPFI